MKRPGREKRLQGLEQTGPVRKGRSPLPLALLLTAIGLLMTLPSSLITAANAPAEPAKKGGEVKVEAKADENKAGEMALREEALRKEEERIKLLKKELDEKIDLYTRLLAKVEEALKSMETARDERYEHLIKVYEAMPNEEAGSRLAVLDEKTAVNILVRMKSKKAGAVMAAMEPRKAAALTESMMSVVKKVPAR